MTRIVIDSSFREKICELTEVAELCDESGKVLGQFLPQVNIAQYEPLEPQISREEIRRRIKSKGQTYTTAEVIAHLESLECTD